MQYINKIIIYVERTKEISNSLIVPRVTTKKLKSQQIYSCKTVFNKFRTNSQLKSTHFLLHCIGTIKFYIEWKKEIGNSLILPRVTAKRRHVEKVRVCKISFSLFSPKFWRFNYTVPNTMHIWNLILHQTKKKKLILRQCRLELYTNIFHVSKFKSFSQFSV